MLMHLKFLDFPYSDITVREIQEFQRLPCDAGPGITKITI